MTTTIRVATLLALSACQGDIGLTYDDDPPSAWLVSHESGAVVPDGPTIFRGSAADRDFPSDQLRTRWYLDGEPVCAWSPAESDGSTQCLAELPVGDHLVSLEVRDPEGRAAVAKATLEVVRDTAPAAFVVSPADGATVDPGEVRLSGVVSDAEDPPVHLEVRWSSSLDGPLDLPPVPDARGVTEGAAALSPGGHRLTLTVTDTAGHEATAQVDVTVGSAGEPPVARVIAPVSGAVVREGTRVGFVGTVFDAETPPDALAIAWSSHLDGPLGADPADADGHVALSALLAPGLHTITLAATDPEGGTGEDAVAVTVDALPSAPVIHIQPAEPTTVDDLRVVMDAPSVDPEGDPVTYTWAWTVDGAPTGVSRTERVAASETTRGQTWAVTVTPFDRLGPGPSGVAVVTIANSPPVVESATLAPDPAPSYAALSCLAGPTSDADADPVTVTARWRVDGVRSDVVGPTAPPGAFPPGASVVCELTPSDGLDDGAVVASPPVVVNTPPVAEVWITPRRPLTSDVVRCEARGLDVDGDPVTLTRAWRVDGVDVAESGVELSRPLSSGQTVRCEVWPADPLERGPSSVDEVVVRNRLPTVTVELWPDPPMTDDWIEARIRTFDADGDEVGRRVSWRVDGVEVPGLDAFLDGRDAFDRDQRVEVQVVPFDGAGDGLPATAAVVVANSPPSAPALGIEPSPAHDDDPLVCRIEVPSYDPDGDLVRYGVEWWVDGAPFEGVALHTEQPGDTLDAADTVDGARHTCVVRPSDGTATGPRALATARPGACGGVGDELRSLRSEGVSVIDRDDGSWVTAVEAPLPPANTLAVRPSDGLAIALSSSAGRLHRLDPCTGATELLAEIDSDSGCGMAFDGDERLFLVGSDDRVHELDPDRGAHLGAVSMSADIGSCGLAWSCTLGSLVGVDQSSGWLWTLDPDTGAVGPLWRLPFDPGANVGLAVDADGVAWTIAEDHLWSIDLVTGAVTRVAPSEHEANDLTMVTCP